MRALKISSINQTEQRIRTRSEEVLLVPLEEIQLSGCYFKRTYTRSIKSASSSEEDEDTSSIDGLGDWSDHNLNRKMLVGVWFRIVSAQMVITGGM